MFQFPTGWNSTNDETDSKLDIRVSIPNGMEFYCAEGVIEKYNFQVSIPNGMEFYFTFVFSRNATH